MLSWLGLELVRLRPRVGRLLAFGALFIAAAATARLTTGSAGQVEFDALMQLGGYPMLSAVLSPLAGGTLPMIGPWCSWRGS